LKTQAHDFLGATSSWLIPCRQKFDPKWYYLNYIKEYPLVNKKISPILSIFAIMYQLGIKRREECLKSI
jgi:hypothetical protein